MAGFKKYWNKGLYFPLILILILLVVLNFGGSLVENFQAPFLPECSNIQEVTLSTPIATPNTLSSSTRILKKLLNCKDRPLQFQRVPHGEYYLLRNLVIGSKSRHMGCADSITYTTHGDYTFFDHLETVVRRWQGPVGFAIYAPGHDMKATLDAIQYVRNCLPDSQLISEYVSFHIYFPRYHLPPYSPLSEEEVINWPYNCVESDGSLAMPPYVQVNRSSMYRTQKNLTYPINVGRNIARMAVNTHFIFACDIELYPSLGFVEQFLDMVASNPSVLGHNESQSLRVFALPVFEIEKNETVPDDKSQLLTLLHRKRAVPFHAFICNNCHKLPGHDRWIQRGLNASDKLEIHSKGLRQKQFKYLEPFYVSENTEPFFDERVTWEGRSNKRIQNYAMCLLGYEYHVLHPAFLVHSPGIKKSVDKARLQYAQNITKYINSKIKPEYKAIYGINKNCNV